MRPAREKPSSGSGQTTRQITLITPACCKREKKKLIQLILTFFSSFRSNLIAGIKTWVPLLAKDGSSVQSSDFQINETKKKMVVALLLLITQIHVNGDNTSSS